MIKHLKEQPFVVATALSALIHSTWALGVLFAGHPPAFEVTFWYVLELAYWLIPALLIAIALDVGQVATANSIRRKPTLAKYVTFGVFALATYYLQWSYMLYHMPDLTPSTGISDAQRWLIEPLRNMALWIIPSLLPLSTTLYTLSSDADAHSEAALTTPINTNTPSHATVMVSAEPKTELVAVNPVIEKEAIPAISIEELVVVPAQSHVAVCPHCGWEGSGNYATEQIARKAVGAHLRHCPSLYPERFPQPSLNGHSQEASEWTS